MSEKNTRRPDDVGRERGILTKADREFLLGEKEDLKQQSKREARQRIRNRFKNSLLDLALLNRTIKEDDRERVAKEIFSDSNEGNLQLTHILGLVYRMMLDATGDPDISIERFESSISDAIESTLRRIEENVFIDVGVSISVDRREAESVLEKYQNRNETFDELLYLQRNGKIETDTTYYEHLFEKLWERGQQFAISSPDGGMNMIDPDNYEEKTRFVQTGVENMVNSRNLSRGEDRS